MARSARLRLMDILGAFDAAESFVEGMTLEGFEGDLRAQFAVARALEIVGEASQHVPESLKARYPDVPWSLMQGMRNQLIHAYFGTNLNVVWRTVKERLPEARPLVTRVLADLPPDA